MIEEDLYTYLSSDGTISGYVSNRIYPVKMPQNVIYPAITYQLIGSTRMLTQSGAVSLVESRYQIDIWSTTYSVVKNIAQSVKNALHGFKGTMGNSRIQGIWQETNSEQDIYEDGTELNRVSHDFIIYYEE